MSDAQARITMPKAEQATLEAALAINPHQGDQWLELARIQREYDISLAHASYAKALEHGCEYAKLEAPAIHPDTHIRFQSPLSLWTNQRLDIAVKVLYARLILNELPKQHNEEVRALYHQHIALRTGGKEPGSAIKLSVEDYERSYQDLILHMKSQGFSAYAAIPISKNGLILNGAHRLAAAIALGIETIPCFVVENMPTYDWGMRWFLHHQFTPKQLNLILKQWLSCHQKTAYWTIIEISESSHATCQKLTTDPRVVAWRELWLEDISLLTKLGFYPYANTQGLLFRFYLMNDDNFTLEQRDTSESINKLISKNSHESSLLATSLLDEETIDRLRGHASPEHTQTWINKTDLHHR